jgi:geranylgeranyl diphosphate synthase type I
MIQNSYTSNMLSAIENELQRIVARLDTPSTKVFHEMLTYHMGWSGEGAGSEASGKRIRPLLVLLSCAALGKDWQCALSSAASLELIHDFSLAHDDIQDGSELRRGRTTVWKKWGMAQAINVGDALFILAHLALQESKEDNQTDSILQIWGIINEACLALSSGQFLDIDYEKRTNLSIDDYWQMVSGKTATLLSACTHVGAILGRADKVIQEKYRRFGYYLGLAFQVKDDYLGIWGDSALTGKSTESDLVAGKKTLPVVFGLTKKGSFAHRWAEGSIHAGEVVQLSEQLTKEGAQSYTQEAVSQMTDLALQSLYAANPQGMAGDVLFDLTNTLLSRKA